MGAYDQSNSVGWFESSTNSWSCWIWWKKIIYTYKLARRGYICALLCFDPISALLTCFWSSKASRKHKKTILAWLWVYCFLISKKPSWIFFIPDFSFIVQHLLSGCFQEADARPTFGVIVSQLERIHCILLYEKQLLLLYFFSYRSRCGILFDFKEILFQIGQQKVYHTRFTV